MLKYLAAAFLLAAPAQAATIDFSAEADTNGERGLSAAGENLTINGVDMFITSSGPAGAQHGYLDGSNANGPAGLGACTTLTASFQCTPNSDDNIQAGESVTIEFTSETYSIVNLSFRDDDHFPLTDGQVMITTDNGSLTDMFSAFIAMAQMGDAFFANLSFISFANAGTNFYVSSMEVAEVPLPAGLPLLISGLAGLGFIARKKRKTA